MYSKILFFQLSQLYRQGCRPLTSSSDIGCGKGVESPSLKSPPVVTVIVHIFFDVEGSMSSSRLYLFVHCKCVFNYIRLCFRTCVYKYTCLAMSHSLDGSLRLIVLMCSSLVQSARNSRGTGCVRTYPIKCFESYLPFFFCRLVTHECAKRIITLYS